MGVSVNPRAGITLIEIEESVIRGYQRETYNRVMRRAYRRFSGLPLGELRRLAEQVLVARFGPGNYRYLDKLGFYDLVNVIVRNTLVMKMMGRGA